MTEIDWLASMTVDTATSHERNCDIDNGSSPVDKFLPVIVSTGILPTPNTMALSWYVSKQP